VAVYKRPGFPDEQQLDDKAKIRIDQDSESDVSITLVSSADGSDICELAAHVQGNAAVLEPSQPCFTSEGEGGTQGELTQGRAVLDGNELKMEAEGTLSVPDQQVDVELRYTFKGKRQ